MKKLAENHASPGIDLSVHLGLDRSNFIPDSDLSPENRMQSANWDTNLSGQSFHASVIGRRNLPVLSPIEYSPFKLRVLETISHVAALVTLTVGIGGGVIGIGGVARNEPSLAYAGLGLSALALLFAAKSLQLANTFSHRRERIQNPPLYGASTEHSARVEVDESEHIQLSA